MSRTPDKDEELHDMMQTYSANRRRFLRNTAGAGAGLFGSVLLGACGGNSSSSNAQAPMGDAPDGGPSDPQILNFALNLEYLEAEFYLRAATGQGLSDDLITGVGGPPGMVTGGAQVPFQTPTLREYANEIADDERDHVAFLRAGLGNAAVARPTLNLQEAFTTAAQAAGIVQPGQMFDPYANENNFLLAAYIFEDVGVTAYKGAARFVDNPDFLEAAAGLLAAEAYHAGLLRGVLYSLGANMPALRDNADAISDARDSLDGPDDLDQGISPRMVTLNDTQGPVTASNIVPLDDNGLAFSRSPGQVLNVVYLTSGSETSGGFFPDGVNGDLNTSADSS